MSARVLINGKPVDISTISPDAWARYTVGPRAYRWMPGDPTYPFTPQTSVGGGVNVTLRAVHGPPGIEAEPEAGTPSRRHGCAAVGGTHHHLEDR